MLKLTHAEPEAAFVDPLAGDEATFSGEFDAQAFPVRDLELLRLEILEMKAEIRETREALDETVRLAIRRDRIRTAARARRQHRSRGSVIARAILSLTVAVLTLGGAIAGVGVAVTVTHVWGGSGYVLVAAIVFGAGAALCAWVCAALAAIVAETADSIRDLPV
ncbi:MAG: hypothetical protein ACRDLM_10940 [Gaiellaceae bacterium]